MKKPGILFTLLLATTALVPAASAQTITYTTTGTLSTISGSDRLGLNGTTFTVVNTLTQGQLPLTGTTDQYTTNILSVADPGIGLDLTNVPPGTVTLNYVGAGSSGNNIGLAATIQDIITLNVTSTIYVPSISGISPGPIASTPLTAADTLTVSNGSSETVYGFSTGTISSVPVASDCTFTVTPPSLTYPVAGGSSTLTVTAGPDNPGSCNTWTAVANQPWIELSPTSGTGSGTVLVTVPANNTGGTLSGVITIAGQTVTVSQASLVQCSFILSPTTLSYPEIGGSTPVTITASSASCAWTATSGDPWLSVNTSSGTGNGTVLVTALANNTGGPLSGSVTIAGQAIPVSEAGVLLCTYSVTPPSGSFSPAGGTITLGVTASNPSCAWTATSSQTWATLSSAAGTGNGSVVVTTAPNTGTQPEAVLIAIAGQSVPLIESGSSTICAFAVGPTAFNFPGAVTTAVVGVAATISSCTWDVSDYPIWLTLSSTTGTGNGSVTVIAGENTTPTVRTGDLTVAGVTLPLTQLSLAGCTFTVTPSTLNFGSAGGSGSLKIKAVTDACQWTATSNQSWSTVSPTSGTGNGTVTVTATANNSPTPQTGTVLVADQIISLTESGLTGCYFTVTPSSLSFPGSGATMALTITASLPTCSWTAASSSTWVSFNPSSGTGSGTTQVTAASNSTNAVLTGTATVGGQTIPLTEAVGAACAFTLSSPAILFPVTGGSLTENIVANGNACAWTASASLPFMTITPTSGVGNGSVLVTVGNDTNGASQIGTLLIAGITVPVTETGSCSFTVSPTSLALDANGGSQVFTVSGPSASCTWTANTNVAWATPSASTGVGSGTITLTIPANTTGADLTGSLTIAGNVVPLSEAFTVQAFADVPPSAYYFDAVNIMAAMGITSGCAVDEFCPNNSLTRAEMAVFLVRGAYGTGPFTYSPTPYFTDVQPTDFGFAYIQKLYELGITAGCAVDLFCPNEVVTRDQMAVFLIRDRLGATTVFTYPGTPYFTDVPASYWAFAWIQRLDYDQITQGCAPNLYCPTESVTRGETSELLVRALFNDLLPPTTPVITQISPNVLPLGQMETVTITGTNTSFVQGTTTLSPIPGVTIGAITVTSPTQMSVALTASATAPQQPNAILVITGTQQAVLPNALTVQ